MRKIFLNTNQWIKWTIPPLMTLTLITIVVSVGIEWIPSRTGYWLIQEDIFLRLNEYLSIAPATLWANLTMVGDGSILLPIFSVLIIWRRQLFFAVLAAIPLASIFSVVGKGIASIPRPAAVLDNHSFHIIGDSLTSHNSLPSGHSITIFAALIAVMAALYPNPKNTKELKTIFFVLTIGGLLCLSRVAVGAHWPIDVAAGASLGWLAGLSGAAIVRSSSGQWFYNTKGCLIMGWVLIAGSYVLAQRALIESELNMPVVWLSVGCGLTTSIYLLSQHKGTNDRSSLFPKPIMVES